MGIKGVCQGEIGPPECQQKLEMIVGVYLAVMWFSERGNGGGVSASHVIQILPPV